VLVGGDCCVHILGSHVERTTLKTEAATCSETSVTKYQLAKLYIPEDFFMHLAPCHKLTVTTFSNLLFNWILCWSYSIVKRFISVQKVDSPPSETGNQNLHNLHHLDCLVYHILWANSYHYVQHVLSYCYVPLLIQP